MTIASLSPSSGPMAGGTSVVLIGTGFAGTTAVRFGTTPAMSFTVDSATSITAVAPAGIAGTVDIIVISPGGTSILGNSYFFRNAPVLTAVTPDSGPLSGGNTVTVTGAHLLEATSLRFGSTAAGGFTVVSDTRITAIAPTGTVGTVGITVTTAGGTSDGYPYTYQAAPIITSLDPAQGATSSGNAVTVTGANLVSTRAVLFGTAPASFTVTSDSKIIAYAPPGVAGPVDVTASTPGGTSAPRIYTRVLRPAI
ncbi:IPT/TIG domain-containing protein [Nocardia sp. NPDC049220]|uniref:IPT/TIG domain-containing protein n=1 Tax=Nocardia sp. NPDC049220 TaxID=3155273 RepID=UPI0033F17BEB